MSAGPDFQTSRSCHYRGSSPHALPNLDGILQAQERISQHLAPTPLIRSAALSSLLGADIWLKVECVSPIASFKTRGALNHVIQAMEAGPCETAVTSSTGNHGQGVACAASMVALRSDIFLPLNSVRTKRRMIELFGGTVHEIGHDIDSAKEHARAFAADRKATFVDDGESLAVMEGAGTIGVEIVEGLSDIDRIYVPMGSGVLATGLGTAVQALQPSAEVIAVQSHGSPAMVESFRAGRAVERPIATFADCIVCRVPAVRALEGILHKVTDCRLVTDDELLSAMHTMLVWGHLLIEPGSAAVLAGAFADRSEISGKRVVLVATGANVDSEMIARAVAAPILGVV
jgi:threonine dehydratase